MASTSVRRRRSRWLWIWAAGAVAVIVPSFLAGTQVSSPWDEAISNSRHDPLVTATVERRTIATNTVQPIGAVSLGTETSVVAGGEGVNVVTHVPPQGPSLTSGQMIVQVSGRPLIALELPFTLYRDLVPGSDGPDVEAVQEALAELGLYTGDRDGVYGAETASAVEALYRRVSADAPEPPTEAQAALDEAEEALLVAESVGAPGNGPDDPTDGGGDASALRRALDRARFETLTPLPAREIVQVEAGTQVVSVAPVGTELDADAGGVVATLRSGSPTVTVRVGAASIDVFQEGAEVSIRAVSESVDARTAQVSSVSEFQSSVTEDGGPPGYDVTVTMEERDGLTEGQRVVVEPANGFPTVEGLAVPLVAIREDSSGTYVLTPDQTAVDEEPRREPVEIAASGNGYAIVRADLGIGDTVVVSGLP